MRTLQEEFLALLGDREMDEDDLVKEVKSQHPEMLTFDVRSALLPLMSTGQVELSKGGRIRAVKCKQAAVLVH